jgi:glycosyltransferase involved in cell wall biosynthesis
MSNVDRPLRVLLVAPTFGAYGGMEAFTLAVARAASRDRQCAVRVCFKRTATFALRPELERACQGLPVEFCSRASRALWHAVGWADVVHAQSPSPDLAVVAALRRKPLAMSVHNVLARPLTLRGLVWRAAARLARVRWYNSTFVWHSWEPRPRRGSAHVPPVSDLPSVQVPPAERRGFIFLGRLVPGKGADVLLDAYRQAALDPDRWPLTIAGDGPMRSALEAQCARDSLPGVSMTGFLDDRQKAAALARAKWLVAPSHWLEPFGLVALEARSVGIPCIVTRDGGLPEAAGPEALVCAPRDAAELAAVLRHAAAMPDDEYAGRAARTRESLGEAIVPAGFYPEAYRRLMAAGQ